MVYAYHIECLLSIYSYYIVLAVEFTSGQFTGSESSGFIEVIVRITGGTSSSPITVTVTSSPVSAIGMWWLSVYNMITIFS